MIQVLVAGALVSAQFERGPDIHVGQEITLGQRPDAVHAFDPDSERSVLASAN
jgi:multiple sugar transport system ATP-binding protein